MHRFAPSEKQRIRQAPKDTHLRGQRLRATTSCLCACVFLLSACAFCWGRGKVIIAAAIATNTRSSLIG
jgi:hypothetical protein